MQPGKANLLDLIQQSGTDTKAVLVICAIFSVVSWYVIAAKWWEFHRIARQQDEFMRATDRVTTFDERQRAMGHLRDSPYAAVVRSAAEFLRDLQASMERGNVTRSGLSLTQLEALTMSLDSEVQAEVDHAGRMTPWLATIGTTAPLLGLFGTVLGIMNAFQGIGAEGSGNLQTVAPGIASALIATAAGLGTAIPAVVAYNVFTNRTNRLEGELERVAQDTIAALGREGRL